MAARFMEILIPFLIHMILTDMGVIFFGGLWDLTVCTTLSAIAAIPIGIWMMRRDRMRGVWQGKHLSEPKDTMFHSRILPGILCLAAGAGLNMLWSQGMVWLHLTQPFSNETQETLLLGSGMIQLIGLGVLVPLSEELFFRGLIYTRMKRMMSVRAAIFCSALIFAVYHGNMIQIIFAFPMAIVLAIVYEKGDWFGFPLLFHMGSNLFAVILQFFL